MNRSCASFRSFARFAVLIACLAGCSGGEDPSAAGPGGKQGASAGDNPLGLIRPGVLRVGTEPGYPPFELKAADGSTIGYDIEVVRRLAEHLGLELEVTEAEFDGLIPALQTRKIDMVISGMTITEERARVVLFTRPYYRVGQVIMLRSELADRVKSAADLNSKDFRVAVQTATTGFFAAEKHVPEAKLIQFQSAQLGAMAMLNGNVDAMIFDDAFIRIFAAEHPGRVTALLEPFTREDLGIAVRGDNHALLDAADAWLEGFLGSEEAARLEREYFEELVWRDK